jgi:hypothetical protein
MVWQGLTRAQAAEAAGMRDNSLYIAFRRPEVKTAYLAECEVLRTSHRSRAIQRLAQIGDASDNMPAVQALKTLHPELGQPEDMRAVSGIASTPGVVIRIVSPIAPPVDRAPLLIDVTPVSAPSSSSSFD